MKYKPDPLKVDEKKDKCAVELAEERGPAFTALAVMLFHQGCEMHNHDRQTMLKFLAQRKHIGDHTVSVYIYIRVNCVNRVLLMLIFLSFS